MASAMERWRVLVAFVNDRIGAVGLRDPEAPCGEFDAQHYNGLGKCLSDGHYLCAECSHLSASAPRFETREGRGDRLRLYWSESKRRVTRRLVSVLLVLLACAGCASTPHQWRLEGDTPAERASVQSAFAEWCNRGGYCDSLSDDGDSKLFFSGPWRPGIMGTIYTVTDQFGNIDAGIIQLRLNRESPDWLDQVRRVTLHELGHWYRGLDSHLPAGNVMTPCYETAAKHLTAADLTDDYQLIDGCGDS
jgi:hypothetical protein